MPEAWVDPSMGEAAKSAGNGHAVGGVVAGRAGRNSASDARSFTTFLGWVGVAVGALEFIAPAGMSRAVGLRPSARTTGVVRAMGLRKLTNGAQIVSDPESRDWVGARLGDDAVDLALLGLALLRSERPLRTLLATAAVIGVGALDWLSAEKLAAARKPPTRE